MKVFTCALQSQRALNMNLAGEEICKYHWITEYIEVLKSSITISSFEGRNL